MSISLHIASIQIMAHNFESKEVSFKLSKNEVIILVNYQLSAFYFVTDRHI